MARNRVVIWLLLTLWAGAAALSLLALAAEPTGDGFTRGLNRLTGFVGWQAVALALALAAWLASRKLPKGDPQRWLARVPGWAGLAVVTVIAGYIAVGVILSERMPPPSPPAGAATAPAE